jgi:hypothetical protein
MTRVLVVQRDPEVAGGWLPARRRNYETVMAGRNRGMPRDRG